MSILFKHLPFVKEQLEFHQRMADKFGAVTFRANLHKGTAEKFSALVADLENADKQLDTPQPMISPPTGGAKKPLQLSLTIDEIEGLPEELLEELNLSGADRTEFAIVNAIEEAGGIITLNRLLIALFKKTGEVYKRQSLYSSLARLVQKNMIYYVPGKKGVYSNEQLSTEDVMRLFGTVREETDDTAS